LGAHVYPRLLVLLVRPWRIRTTAFMKPSIVPNNAIHTDSARTLRFQIQDHWRGAGDGERWANSPA
jgi:hypothetical protein